MSMVEDILIRIKGEDQTSSVFSKIRNSSSGMKMALGSAMTVAGAGMASFAKSAVSSAMTAETEWNRFGAAVNSTGGNWESQSASIKKWVSNYSTSMGRATGDTRSAMTAMMNYGLSAKEAQSAMSAVSGMAAAMGTSQEEASNKLVKAFAGQGRSLKTLGINLDDYKDSATGAIDKQRLLRDITDKTKDASNKYSHSTAADMARINKAIASIKTDFGKALLSAIAPLLPVVQGMLGLFNALPQPIQTIIFVFGGLVAAVGLLTGPVMTIMGAFETLGITLSSVTSLLKIGETATVALTSAETAAAAAKAGLTSAELGSAAAHAGTTAAVTAEAGATSFAAKEFLAMAAAELTALAPILAIVAAVAGVVLVIEKLGEVAGWWDDFGSMIEAISSGVNRLWKAFANSPQVQGTIKDIMGVFQALYSVVEPIVNAIQSVWNGFVKSMQGLDPVKGIMGSFQALGSVAGNAVKAVKNLPETLSKLPGQASAAFSGISNYLGSIGSKAIKAASSILTGFSSTFKKMPTNVSGNLNVAYATISSWASKAGSRMRQAATLMLNGISRVRQIPTRINSYLARGIAYLAAFAINAANRARNAGLRILQGLSKNIARVPTTVWSYMSQVPNRIASAATAAVSAASSLASQVVTAVINGITGLADKVYQEFMKIPGKIKSSMTSAISAAASWASGVLDGALDALGIHSPGIIQNKVALEFANIPGRISESNRSAFSAAQGYASNVLNGFNRPVTSNIGAYRQAGQTYNNNKNSRQSIVVNFNENSIPINANNLNPNECKAIVINALESIDSVKNSNIRGAY